MSGNCPNKTCVIKDLCSEMHKTGCAKDLSWLAIFLFARNIVTQFSLCSELQKAAIQKYVLTELAHKNPSPEHFQEVVLQLEKFIMQNNKMLELKNQFDFQREITNALALAINDFLKNSLVSEHERARLISKFGGETLEALSSGQELGAMVPRLKTLVKDMLLHYRQEAHAWEKKAKILEQTVNMDPLLAPLHNRCALDAHLRQAVERCQTEGMALSVLMIDIDNFKMVNDTHGHQVGDDVLRALAKIINIHASMYGWFSARYGGDELTVVCEAPVDDALFYADAVRLAVQNYAFRPRIGEKLAADPIRFTISIGVAAYQPGMSPEELLDAADRAMYCVKDSGKNSVANSDVLQNASK